MNDAQALWMHQALQQAKDGMRHQQGGPFGAVIVRDGEVIGRGCNKVTSTFDPTAHAEMVAIRQAAYTLKDYSLSGCELYTSCEPCPMCLAAAYWARLDAVYYAATRLDASTAGFDDAWIYQELSLSVHERALPMVKVADKEAITLLQEWASNPDKLAY